MSSIQGNFAASFGGGFQPLALGAGGYLTGIDIASDGTVVVRTDTMGAYVGSTVPGTRWRQLLTVQSMPAGSVNFDGSTYIFAEGVYEVRIAPSNSNVLYMLYLGQLYKSTNKGGTWIQLGNFPALSAQPNPNGPYRMAQQKIAVDPNNANCVIVGTPQDGTYYTTDGGQSWNKISSIPTGGTDTNGIYPGVIGVCFDPASGTTGGLTNTAYVPSFGNGVYQTTTGVAGTWSLLSGSPEYVESAVVANGNYMCCANATTSGVASGLSANNLMIFSGGSWATSLTGNTNGLHAVTVNPASPSEEWLAVDDAGGMFATANGGSSWGGPSYQFTLVATDIPWLASTGSYLSAGGFIFDPSSSNKVWLSMGVGVVNATLDWWSGFSYATEFDYDSQSAGIEQLVARAVVSPPSAASVPIVAVEDRSEFAITNPASYPSSYSTEAMSSGAVCAGWSVDYAKASPLTLVAINNHPASDYSAYSTDGGAEWAQFGAVPVPGYLGGCIAASTAENFVAIGSNGPTNANYSTDGGAAWSAASGLPTTGWSPDYQNLNNLLCADAAGNGTFYLLNLDGAVYVSANGGESWSAAAGSLTLVGSYNVSIASVPGNPGHLFATSGYISQPHPYTSSPFYFSENGSASWSAVPDVVEVWVFGFGAAYPGQSYPTVWIVGWVNNGSGYQFGVWVCKNFNPSTASGAWTWLTDFPFGSIDQIVCISGDANDHTKCYFGFQGSGFGYGSNLKY